MSEDRIYKNKYTIKTPGLCKALGVTRMTLYNWEQEGKFDPPRSARGDRVFTKNQVNQIVKAFGPGGKGYWRFEG